MNQKIIIGTKIMNAQKMIDTFSVAIEKFRSDEIKKIIEPKYVQIINVDDLSNARRKLELILNKVQSNQQKHRAIIEQLRNEKKVAIKNKKENWNENILSEEMQLKNEIAQMEKNLSEKKAHLKKVLRDKKLQRNIEVTSLRESFSEQILNHQKKSQLIQQELVAELERATEVLTEIKGNFIANCNEKEKRHFVDIVFPRIKRKKIR